MNKSKVRTPEETLMGFWKVLDLHALNGIDNPRCALPTLGSATAGLFRGRTSFKKLRNELFLGQSIELPPLTCRALWKPLNVYWDFYQDSLCLNSRGTKSCPTKQTYQRLLAGIVWCLTRPERAVELRSGGYDN